MAPRALAGRHPNAGRLPLVLAFKGRLPLWRRVPLCGRAGACCARPDNRVWPLDCTPSQPSLLLFLLPKPCRVRRLAHSPKSRPGDYPAFWAGARGVRRLTDWPSLACLGPTLACFFGQAWGQTSPSWRRWPWTRTPAEVCAALAQNLRCYFAGFGPKRSARKPTALGLVCIIWLCKPDHATLWPSPCVAPAFDKGLYQMLG